MDWFKEWGIGGEIEAGKLPDIGRHYDLGFVGEYVEQAGRLTDAPTTFQVGCSLTLLSGLVGPAIRIGDSQLAMWVLLLGSSGRARKSTCLHLAEDLVYRADSECIVPVHFSLQSLIDLFSNSDETWRGLFLPYDEFSQFLKRYASVEMMSGVGETLIKAYDGAPLGYSYKQSGTKRAHHPYLAMLATGVPETLGKHLSRDVLSSGFLARWILLFPTESEMGRTKLSPFDRQFQFDPIMIRKSMEVASWYQRVVSGSSDFQVRQGDQIFNVDFGRARQLPIETKAREIISQYWWDIEELIESGVGRLGEGQAESLARARERASKISALLAIGDGPPKGDKLPEVRAHHAAVGVILSKWFEERRARAVDKLVMHFERRVKQVQVLPALRRLTKDGEKRTIGGVDGFWFRRTEIQAEANIGKRTARNALNDLMEEGTVKRLQVYGKIRGMFYSLSNETEKGVEDNDHIRLTRPKVEGSK